LRDSWQSMLQSLRSQRISRMWKETRYEDNYCSVFAYLCSFLFASHAFVVWPSPILCAKFAIRTIPTFLKIIGLPNRHLGHSCGSQAPCPRRHSLFICELRPGDCDGTLGYTWYLSNGSNDRRTCCLGFNVDLPIQTAKSRLNGIYQTLLQTHLGSLLSGIWTVYINLKHIVRCKLQSTLRFLLLYDVVP
jgi:hypothetical protein